MQIDHLNRLKAWFDAYTHSFLTGEAAMDSPLILKIEHTARVRENICHLGQAIDLTDGQLRIAEAIGLFHDVGRFLQYRRYQTFNDRLSANHAALGIEVLRDIAIFNDLCAEDQAMIVDAIRFHNAPALPGSKSPISMVFMRLIRDADKLDIWKVFADYSRNHQRPDPGVVQHLSDEPIWTDTIVKTIVEKHMAKFQDMKTVIDFKLLQLSWVFDLNFPETYVQARHRGDLDVIAQSLPDSHAVNQAVGVVMEQLEKNACPHVR